jgi:phosphopantothenoylcysteine synthetase/decarboxylase
MPRLTLVVCGAPLAVRATEVASAIEASGWVVSTLPTEAATAWTGTTSSIGRLPSGPKRARPEAVVVCPMTFNTANKWAAGIADTQPLSLLCESLGLGIPIVAVPFVNQTLWQHPNFKNSLRVLERAGVQLIDPRNGRRTPEPLEHGTGDLIANAFDPIWVHRAIAHD